MADVLIGHTGFIGSSLLTQHNFDACFNSKNIYEIQGGYDTVVCCGAPGTKWIANTHPDEDRERLSRLLEGLDRLAYRPPLRFFLISTADVFGQPVDADERTPTDPDCMYGGQRRNLECAVQEMFENCHIVRLPGVIGPGLKKGPIFDLQNEHRLEYLNPDSVYQWYDVSNLWRDLQSVTHPITHFCPPPESLRETVRRDFPHLEGRLTGTGTPAQYNLRTRYSTPTKGMSKVEGGPKPSPGVANARA